MDFDGMIVPVLDVDDYCLVSLLTSRMLPTLAAPVISTRTIYFKIEQAVLPRIS